MGQACRSADTKEGEERKQGADGTPLHHHRSSSSSAAHQKYHRSSASCGGGDPHGGLSSAQEGAGGGDSKISRSSRQTTVLGVMVGEEDESADPTTNPVLFEVDGDAATNDNNNDDVTDSSPTTGKGRRGFGMSRYETASSYYGGGGGGGGGYGGGGYCDESQNQSFSSMPMGPRNETAVYEPSPMVFGNHKPMFPAAATPQRSPAPSHQGATRTTHLLGTSASGGGGAPPYTNGGASEGGVGGILVVMGSRRNGGRILNEEEGEGEECINSEVPTTPSCPTPQAAPKESPEERLSGGREGGNAVGEKMRDEDDTLSTISTGQCRERNLGDIGVDSEGADRLDHSNHAMKGGGGIGSSASPLGHSHSQQYLLRSTDSFSNLVHNNNSSGSLLVKNHSSQQLLIQRQQEGDGEDEFPSPLEKRELTSAELGIIGKSDSSASHLEAVKSWLSTVNSMEGIEEFGGGAPPQMIMMGSPELSTGSAGGGHSVGMPPPQRTGSSSNFHMLPTYTTTTTTLGGRQSSSNSNTFGGMQQRSRSLSFGPGGVNPNNFGGGGIGGRQISTISITAPVGTTEPQGPTTRTTTTTTSTELTPTTGTQTVTFAVGSLKGAPMTTTSAFSGGEVSSSIKTSGGLSDPTTLSSIEEGRTGDEGEDVATSAVAAGVVDPWDPSNFIPTLCPIPQELLPPPPPSHHAKTTTGADERSLSNENEDQQKMRTSAAAGAAMKTTSETFVQCSSTGVFLHPSSSYPGFQ